MERSEFDNRRRHQIFLTSRTEYHLRAEKVIAVRNRDDGSFYQKHSAIGAHLSGMIRRNRGAEFLPSPVWALPGDCLCLSIKEGGLVTGKVIGIKRPSRETVLSYPSE